jgi:osmotically-inducible protein OsmY
VDCATLIATPGTRGGFSVSHDSYRDQRDDHEERDRNLDNTSQQRSLAAGDRSPVAEGDQGNWTGYVVPYRYYGPGYRGVGYYSVMYQGTGDPGDDSSRWAGQQHGLGAGDADVSDRATSSSGPAGSPSPGSSLGRAVGGWGGGHAGRGPKGYRRSDERIKEDVNDLLTADDHIDASEIEVDVRDAVVSLSGTVSDRSAKRRAEDVAERAAGVKDVMNQLRVERSPASAPMRPEDQRGSSVSSGPSQTAGQRVASGASSASSSRRSGSGQSTNGSNRTAAGSR